MKSSIVPVLMAAILPLAGIAATESEFTVSLWAKLAQFPDPNGDSKKGETTYGLFSANWDVRMMIGADRKLSAQVTIKGTGTQTTTLKITGFAEELHNLRSKPRILMITNAPDKPKVVLTLRL